MKTVKMPVLFCAMAMAVAAHASSTSPSWVRVETLTVQGVANGLPGGAAVHRQYSGGTYRFSLDLTSPGITYSGGRPPEISAFVSTLDSAVNAVGTHTFGLNQDFGPVSAVQNSDTSFSVDCYIVDTPIWDNGGSVRIFVDKWE